MNIGHFSHKQYKEFCSYDGSEHIVSEFALKHILLLIKKFNVEKILEIGVGIGTISGSIIEFSKKENLNIEVTGTEANKFCLQEIPRNLGENFKRLKLYKNLSDIPDSESYDLIIVDGSEANLEKVQYLANPSALILIEGDRSGQVKTIEKIFKNSKYVQLISLSRNGVYSVKKTEHYQGGLKVVFTKPSKSQLRYWIQSKIKTKTKYLIRKN